jgi:2-dehydropantoate 2-reductase
VVVFGAGAIGCWIGGRLAASGVDVTLVGRPRVLDELAHGLQISELGGGQWTVHPKTTTEAVDGEIILVTVKSAQTADAARALASTTGTIVSLQNGVRNVPLLREMLPGRTVVAGMVPFNVVRRGPGSYHRSTSGALTLDRAGSAFADLCKRADLPCELRDDMPAVQWAKLVINLNNATNALSGLPLQQQLAQRDYRRVIAATQREALVLLRKAGIAVARLTPIPMRLVPWVLELPDAVFQRLARRMVAIDPTARSSMWADLEAKRPTEIDYINGEIVALAERLGARAPINAKLVELIRAAEQGGKRDFSAQELHQALHSITAKAPAMAPTSSASRNRP